MTAEITLTPRDATRFWLGVNKEGPHSSICGSRCWEWTRGTGKSGYGNFHIRKLTVSAHRASFAIQSGRSTFGWVLHKCDNRLCVNPAHLFEGNALVNNRDCNAKGRRNTLRGESHQDCKLTDSEIAEISQMKLGRGQYGPLIQRFGVSYKTLWAISRGKYGRKPCTVAD